MMLTMVHRFVIIKFILVVVFRLVVPVLILVDSLFVIELVVCEGGEFIINRCVAFSMLILLCFVHFLAVCVSEHVSVVAWESTGVVRLCRGGVDWSCIVRSSFGTKVTMTF